MFTVLLLVEVAANLPRPVVPKNAKGEVFEASS
jgi:hypothetical protein